MAYKKRTARKSAKRTTGNYSRKRSSGTRKTGRTSSARRTVNTLRIVVEQPQAVSSVPVAQNQTSARKAMF